MSIRETPLKNAQHVIAQKAATIANRMAREQLLGDEAPYALSRRLASLRGRNLATIKQSWSPFVADSSRGLSLRIRDSDAMLMVDFGLLQLTDEDFGMATLNDEHMMINIAQSKKVSATISKIADDAMAEAMIENSPQFVRSMLDDLFNNPQSHYEQFLTTE